MRGCKGEVKEGRDAAHVDGVIDAEVAIVEEQLLPRLDGLHGLTCEALPLVVIRGADAHLSEVEQVDDRWAEWAECGGAVEVEGVGRACPKLSRSMTGARKGRSSPCMSSTQSRARSTE